MKVKRKIKLKRVLILLLVLIIIGFSGYMYLNIRVKNIYVTGITYLKENNLLVDTKLIDYPKLTEVSIKDITDKLQENPWIKNVNVSKNIFGKIIIEIEENKPLYYNLSSLIVLSNGKIIDNQLNLLLPYQKNEINTEIYEKFLKAFTDVDSDVLIKISEIEYNSSTLDNERFLLYMIDGNLVYITLSKINLLNSYNEIYPTLEGKKGILHLDIGNRFEIKE